MTVCEWLGHDEDGRPFCVHGPAISRGKRGRWRCRQRAKEANRRYRASVKGREMLHRVNASDHTRSAKQLYELTRPPRVRVRP